MSVKLKERKDGSNYYLFEKVKNGVRYKYQYSIDKYGKHAKLMAEYSEQNLVKLMNWIEEKDDYLIIYTYNKTLDSYKEILIDKEDYDLVKDYYWSARKNESGNFYAETSKGNAKKGKLEVIKMHRLLANTPEDKIVDHINRNSLDNRKANLRNVDVRGNNTNFNENSSRNSTGFRGVYKEKESYRARWVDKDTMKEKSKSFFIKNYKTEEEAFNAAKEYRIKMAKENDYLLYK